MDPVGWGVVCVVESSLWAGKDSATAILACEGGECFSSRVADSFDPFIAVPVMLVLVLLLLLLLLLHRPNCIYRFCSI